MTKQVIILATGESSRWDGRVKELAEFEGEPLLLRTIRLCRTYQRSIFVATHKPQIWAHADKFTVLIPLAHRCVVETLASTRNIWREQNTILLADVYYDYGLLRQIMNDESNLSIYGDPSEIHAICFKDGLTIIKGSSVVMESVDRGNRGNLRELYHSLIGLPADHYLYAPYVIGDHYIRTDGRAFDIDDYDSYQHAIQWLAAHPMASSFRGIYAGLGKNDPSKRSRHKNRAIL